MKKLIPILMALCLLSAACAQRPREEAPPPPAPEAPAVPEPPAPEEEGRALERLTVELVVDWEDTDRVLEGRAELERLLQAALAGQAWTVEEVQITISTAGDALAAGGVDAACLPEEDCEAREADAFPVLAAPGRVLAVTGAREELDGDFRAALAEALLETEEGAAFLSLYSPDTVYTAAP